MAVPLAWQPSSADTGPPRLRHVHDDRPGISRRRAGRGFTYLDAGGRRLGDRAALSRIQALAIPPAWTDVWICPLANGHIQATGRDARGRKQYRYHELWREHRSRVKHDGLLEFAAALPALRRRVERDLSRRGLPRDKVLALVVRLLETTCVRVGNVEYAKTNDSYGLTTLRDEHVNFHGKAATFSFRGKSGRDHVVEVHDPRLVGLVRSCRDLPGQELFQYREDGVQHDVGSADVNDYLRRAGGEEFTAKTFRTWAGTVLTLEALLGAEPAESVTARRRCVVAAIAATAERLGNRAATCRKYYVHPAVIDAYERGVLEPLARKASGGHGHLRAMERATVAVLEAARARKPVRARA